MLHEALWPFLRVALQFPASPSCLFTIIFSLLAPLGFPLQPGFNPLPCSHFLPVDLCWLLWVTYWPVSQELLHPTKRESWSVLTGLRVACWSEIRVDREGHQEDFIFFKTWMLSTKRAE